MFDVSFTELLTIGVVALIVIGPERLPKVARTVGHLLGRAQRYVSDVKSDIRREMELDELRHLRKEMEDAARSLETTIRTNVDDLNKGLSEVQHTVEEAAREVQAASSEPLPGPAAEPTGDAAGGPHPAAGAEPAHAAETSPTTPPAAGSEPGDDLVQGSLFPADLLPPAVHQPAAGQPAGAPTVRESEKT